NSDVDTCDFYGQVVWDIKTSKTTQLVDTCWTLVKQFYELPGNYDPYNFYQDCYQTISLRKAANFHRRAILAEAKALNTVADLNYDSTDSQNGFPCWDDDVTHVYLNELEVMKALHIDDAWIQGRRIHWEVCK
uniref:LORF2 protein n=1 Tax=Ascaris lumbricoides TaxID=6252 RepID=A0A0M3HH91_ASCLU